MKTKKKNNIVLKKLEPVMRPSSKIEAIRGILNGVEKRLNQGNSIESIKLGINFDLVTTQSICELGLKDIRSILEIK